MKEKDILNEETAAESQEAAATEAGQQSEDPASGQDKESAGTDKEAEQQDPLAKAQQEIDDLKDKYLRSVAEFDNYRKRTLREKADLILGGSERAVVALLPVVDDMERAIAAAKTTDDPDTLREGWDLIMAKLHKALESLGVSAIECDGADFDTDLHEAIAMVPGMGDDKKGKVIDCVQTGYRLGDKVIRHAKVAVGQ